jgi:glutathione S-transferase
MMTLFYAKGACSLASHIALEEAGADYQLRRLDLKANDQRKPEFLEINPKGRVPALLTERGVLTENPVILGYIAQTYPAAELAENDDNFAFGAMQAFNVFLASSVHVAFAHNSRPERYADGDAAAQAMRAKAPEALAGHFAVIEQQLGDGRPYIMGERYTVADGYMFVFERWFERDGLGRLADYPRVRAHHARIAERPAVKAALAAEGDE